MISQMTIYMTTSFFPSSRLKTLSSDDSFSSENVTEHVEGMKTMETDGLYDFMSFSTLECSRFFFAFILQSDVWLRL